MNYKYSYISLASSFRTVSCPFRTLAFPDLVPHLGFVAVHLKVGTEGLCLHKRTFFGPQPGIGIQRCALGAKLSFGAVLLFADVYKRQP